jgi:hypothetical protein
MCHNPSAGIKRVVLLDVIKNLKIKYPIYHMASGH